MTFRERAMAEHNELGRDAELAVHSFLTAKGYRILDNNWRSGHCEIDVVAMDGQTLVIVEVKARSSTDYGLPEEAVDRRKIGHLVNAAESYVNMKDLDVDVRFDIISVVSREDGTYEIEHIEDAFLPPVSRGV